MNKIYIENVCLGKDKNVDLFRHTRNTRVFMKDIMSNYTPSEIAKMIKRVWTDVQEFNVLDFKEIGRTDNYVPNPEKMLQVRKIQVI